jgi:hypothetical protein
VEVAGSPTIDEPAGQAPRHWLPLRVVPAGQLYVQTEPDAVDPAGQFAMHCVAVATGPLGEKPAGQVRRSSVAAGREPSLVGSVQKPVDGVVDQAVHVPAPQTPVSRRYSMMIAVVARVMSAGTVVDGRVDVVRVVVAGTAVDGRVEVTRSVVPGNVVDGRTEVARVETTKAAEPRVVTAAAAVVGVVEGRVLRGRSAAAGSSARCRCGEFPESPCSAVSSTGAACSAAQRRLAAWTAASSVSARSA